MDTSIFLAKVIGVYLLIMSFSMFINMSRFSVLKDDIKHTPSLLLLSGSIALIIGLLLVMCHNIWETDWRVVITLIGWFTLIKGVIRVVFPEWAFDMLKKFIKNKNAYYVAAIISLALGIWLTYFGFR